jgi:hypothetical protein
MRFPRLLALLTVILATAAPALAQRGDEVIIEEARIGLPPGRFVERDSGSSRAAHIVKRNTWAPIYLRLEMKREYQGGAQVRIESSDADELRTTLVVPLIRNLSDRLPGSKIEAVELGAVPYVRSGDRQGEVKLRLYSTPTDGSSPKPISNEFTIRFQQFRDTNTYVVCSLGSKLPGFDLPTEDTRRQGSGSSRSGLRGGRVETASFTNVREMPDQWFGYQAVDLVVLGTGSSPPDFLADLFDDARAAQFRDRRDALLEWVRRGGKLVVSVGSKGVELSGSKLFQDLLPAPLRLDPPTKAMRSLPLRWRVGGNLREGTLRPKTETFPVARLGPNPTRPYRVLLSSSENPDVDQTKTDLPVVVQSPYGLGRITLVAFDIDQSPFTELESRGEFWDYLIREGGSTRAALPPTGQQSTNPYGSSSTDENENEFLAALRTHVDTFDGVPVVSFGWVALFIILYTILIGPVEYLVLRYVFRRLELTWITFPLIVLTVSAAAYFTAYAIKGNDLKVNKVDVVDVDLQGGRVYGRTWFTIFSPRIDSYTIGIEPKEGWTVANPDVQPGTLVDWMAGGRGGGGGIVSRGYGYHISPSPYHVANGLDRVPIQVWSTKAFTANWSGAIDRRRPEDGGTPLLAADLRHPPGDPESVIGSFTNNLPLTRLDEPALIYRGKVYKLPTLAPGQRVEVPAIGQREGGLPLDNDWFGRSAVLPWVSTSNTYSRYGQVQMQTTSSVSLWGALFHEKAVRSEASALQNASLRDLDQSWRLSEEHKDEVILVARVTTANGPAESIMADPQGSSPTRLWLKNLPGGPTAREPVPGTLRQETYVRVFIPIRPARK